MEIYELPFPKIYPNHHGPFSSSCSFNYIDVLKGNSNIPKVLVELLEIKPLTGYVMLCAETYAYMCCEPEKQCNRKVKFRFRLQNGELVDVEKLKVVDMLVLCRPVWRGYFPNNVSYIARFVENAKIFETHRYYVDEMTIDQPDKHWIEEIEEEIKPSFCCRFWKKVKQN